MISGIEALAILGKPFLRTHDIALLLDCSDATASRVKFDVVAQFYDKDQKLTPGKQAVKTSDVIAFLKIDEEEIKKCAEREALANTLRAR